jgi:hypothetical protein
MTGEDKRTPPQSPRSKALLQHFEYKVRLHTKHLYDDVRVTNDCIGQMETAQVDTNTRLATLERSIGDVTSLTAILDRLEKMEPNQHDGLGQRNHNSNNTRGSAAGRDEE